jgi:hypothetical protein
MSFIAFFSLNNSIIKQLGVSDDRVFDSRMMLHFLRQAKVA